MSNRFKDPTMHREYDAVMGMFETKHRNLFMDNGERRHSPNYGSSLATSFWGGFDGRAEGMFNFGDKASRNTLAYAHWRAGQDAAEWCRRADVAALKELAADLRKRRHLLRERARDV